MYNFDPYQCIQYMLYSKCVLLWAPQKINPYSFEIKLKKWINNDRIVILFSPVSPCTIEEKVNTTILLDSLA